MPRECLAAARRVVVKVGSRLLRDSPVARPGAIADELAQLRETRGVEAAIVSSGSIALGMRALKMKSRPRELPRLQAAAAVGQKTLMQNWERAFAAHGTEVGQVLLTHDDVAHRTRFLNARHALAALFELSVVPVINENDTVSVEEIQFGDNDALAALVCNLVGADALVILTDVEGLLEGLADGAPGTRRSVVRDIDTEAAPLVVTNKADGVGTGGMASKIAAARIATASGVPTVLAKGSLPGILGAVLSGQDVGTLFVPPRQRLGSRKHWLAHAARPQGKLSVDQGAATAVRDKGRSLLPSGIVAIEGTFPMGAAVIVVGPDGQEIARGLAGYSSEDLQRIRGARSADIGAILGYKYLDEVIHRDDLVLSDPRKNAP